MGRGLFLKAMNCEFPPARAADVSTTHKRRLVLPPHAPGMRIGLFGGTFDPPHAAHRGACLLAMQRIGLDRVWWLVTPGNPLKDSYGLAPLAARVAAASALAHASAHRRHRSRSRARYQLHLRDLVIWSAVARGCISSGSWAPTICATFIAGSAGAASRGLSRSPWSIGLDRASTRGRRRRSGAGLCASSRNGGKDAAGTKAAGLDLSAWPQIAAVVDRVAGGTGLARQLTEGI